MVGDSKRRNDPDQVHRQDEDEQRPEEVDIFLGVMNPHIGSLGLQEIRQALEDVLELPGMVDRQAGPHHRGQHHQDRHHQQFHHQPGFPGVRGVLRHDVEQAQDRVADAA